MLDVKKNLSQADNLTCDICGWIVCKKCESCGCEYSRYLDSVKKQFKNDQAFSRWLIIIGKII